MIFRSLDINGDWTFGKGKQNYLTETNAIIKNIETMLKTFYSECFFDNEFGIPWFSILGVKNPNILLLVLKNKIINAYGVTKINDVSYEIDNSRNITVAFNINTIYTTSVSGVVTL